MFKLTVGLLIVGLLTFGFRAPETAYEPPPTTTTTTTTSTTTTTTTTTLKPLVERTYEFIHHPALTVEESIALVKNFLQEHSGSATFLVYLSEGASRLLGEEYNGEPSEDFMRIEAINDRGIWIGVVYNGKGEMNAKD